MKNDISKRLLVFLRSDLEAHGAGVLDVRRTETAEDHLAVAHSEDIDHVELLKRNRIVSKKIMMVSSLSLRASRYISIGLLLKRTMGRMRQSDEKLIHRVCSCLMYDGMASKAFSRGDN